MKITTTELQDLLLLEPKIFEDSRGYFYESYNKKVFDELKLNTSFVQDNISKSSKGILRGMHFQAPPFSQGKLVKVIQGSVQDVVVDLRKNSPSFGKTFSVVLSEKNGKMLWIPEGFAHGFLTLEDNTVFYYKCTNFYSKDHEHSILWNDKTLNIKWNTEDPLLSEKDKQGKPFADFLNLF